MAYNNHRNIFVFFNNNICIILISLFSFIITKNAKSETISIENWLNVDTQKTFSQDTNNHLFLNDSFGINFNKKSLNTKLQLNLGITSDSHLKFDHSNISYGNKNVTFGVGKINRHWSLSPKTSLILSHNARPPESVYINLFRKKNPDNLLLSWVGPWSFEAFNSTISDTSGPKNSMLLGLRTIIEPVSGFKFEIVKTSQWGGDGHNKDISAFSAAILGDTNDAQNSNINQLAGFGFSYQPPKQILPFKIYGQFIGEDEAGGLPSCYMHLLGSEFSHPSIKFLTKFGFELVDTRIGRTQNGNCGPNTAYNNGTYKYTNYGKSLGAPIDTEGQSISLWGSMPLSPNINLDYSIERLLINDTNWSEHRLSTNREIGSLFSFGSSWEFNSLKIKNSINYLDFSLDKNNTPKGLSLNLNTIYKF
jgi:hypothetical protein